MANPNKTLLRKQFLKERMSLSAETVELYSQTITDRLIETTQWQQVNSVHVYVPIDKFREINTWPLLDYIWHHWPSVNVAVPGPQTEGLTTSLLVSPATSWEIGKGVHRPERADEIPADFLFDLIVAPLIAFDAAGYRLGFGGGYYDRFLSKQPTARTIGLGYENSFAENGLPHESHDIPLQNIITEQRLITIGS